MIDFATLEAQSLALSSSDRVKLADRLYESVSDFESREIELAWIEEIRRRSEEFDRDPSSGIPHEQVMAEARRMIDEARSR